MADPLPDLGAADPGGRCAAIGHRRKLLDAIAALGATVPTAAVMAPPSDAPAPADAERRQLTVMFCDLVGSTPLSTRFDPEDLRDIIGAYHRCVAETVARFAGFVAKYMGDGVLIYFGYPEAHEDDAERGTLGAPSSHQTPRWRELDSNFQFRKEQDGFPGRAICVAQAGQKGDPAFAQLPGIWRMSVEGRGPR